jgi:hypothetical protein
LEYRIQEGRFDLSDSFHDQTVNVFTVTPSGPSPFNIVMTRTAAKPDVSLKDHVSRELDTMQQALAGFAYLWRREHEVDGRPAEIVAARVGSGANAMEQRQVFLLLGRRALTITASAQESLSQEQLHVLNDLISSLRLAA